MRESRPGAAAKSNLRGEEFLARFGGTPRLALLISQIAAVRWPRKTAIEIAIRAKVSKRQAQSWLAGEGEPSGAAVANLLLSDAGFEFIAALAESAPERPPWYRAIKRQMAISEIRASQARTAKLLEQYEREEGE